jgi:hypothetical protein
MIMSRLCWWCCHPIEGESLGLPYEYKGGQFKTLGQFCTWPCVKAFNIQREKYNMDQVLDLITLYRKKSLGPGTIDRPLKSAPSRLCLKAFGGSLTIEEFRKGVEMNITFPDDIRGMPFVETKIVRDIDPEGPLVLSRPTPLKRETTGIHRFLKTK